MELAFNFKNILKMKNKLSILIFALLIGILSGCEKYLSVPSDATLTEDVIFSTYKTFQGYLDPCYSLISDANCSDLAITNNIGTESVSNLGASPVTAALNQNYFSLVNNGSRSIWIGFEGGTSSPMDAQKKGLYHWWPYVSRIANISLKNLKNLKDASQEEKDKLEGQALFFRAYLNFEVARAFGSVPYLDKVFMEGNEARLPRFWTDSISGKKDFQAVAEKASRDLQRAADILPVEWDAPNVGRITKGAALALKSKVLLYAGSPLFEESSVKGNSAVTSDQTGYNKDYLKRAAESAAEVIKLGKYDLPVWGSTTGDNAGDGYRKNFTTIDGKVPFTNESIFQRWNNNSSSAQYMFRDRLCRIYVGQGALAYGTTGHLESPLLSYMDKFEMSDGTQYKPGNNIAGGYDDNLIKFNNQRDPRFQYNYRTHGEKIGAYTYSGDKKGTAYSADARGPFLMTKYWYPLVDNVNQQWGQFTYRTPSIRYADVLLFYAEAVFEYTGNPDASMGGISLTARQALNAVRNRANMPAFNPAIYSVARTTHGELSTDDPFRLAYRNERCVELAYEGHYWFDLRRWKRIHLLEKQVWILDFNKAYTSVTRTALQPYLFELRNYWLPFPTTDTQIFNGFPQNPGW